MIASSLVDVDALWHVALYSFLAMVGLVTAYGTLVLAVDRAQRQNAPPSSRAAWVLAAALGGLVCVGLLIVGFWAMTQK
jgi:hypothetical protein